MTLHRFSFDGLAAKRVRHIHGLPAGESDAIAAMADKGIDISGQRSKHMDELTGQDFDYVITVCDNARETCPVFPGAPERIHWSIPDPSAVEGTEEAKFRACRTASDDLMTRIRYLLVLIERQRA